MINLLSTKGWIRSEDYLNRHKMEDVVGVPTQFCQLMQGKVATGVVVKSQWFGGHVLRFFAPLETADAFKIMDDRSGGFGLRSTIFILNFADGSRYVHVYPL